MRKKLIALIAVITAASFLQFPSSAEEHILIDLYSEHILYYNELIEATNSDFTVETRKEVYYGDGDVMAGILSADEIELLESGDAVIAFDVDLSVLKPEHRSSPEFGLTLYFQIFTAVDTWYTCELDVLSNPVISAKTLLEKAEVPADKKITAINIFEQKKWNQDWQGKYSIKKDVWWFSHYSFMHQLCVIDTSEKGWQSFGENKYYVKNNGTLAVKSTTIDKIRYTFDKDGVCTGRYTGWTKSEKGRRYWKNGKLLTSQILEGKNGKKYDLDDSGYVTRVED